MMTADDHLLAGAYALGALDRFEAAAFEAHLARCAACRTEVAELTETAALLATAVPAPVSEPLLDRVLQQVRATPQLPPVEPSPGRSINGHPTVPPVRHAAPGGPPPSPTPLAPRREARRARPGARRWLSAAAAIVLVLLAGTITARLIAERAPERQLAAIVEDPGSNRFALRGVGPNPVPVSLGVYVRPGTGEAVVDARSLPALDPGRTYELWFMAEDGALRAATFSPDETGTARVGFTAPVGDPAGFGVTVEPAGGSDQPTSGLVFQGEA
jgi:anti-sigma factor RsiW